MMTDSNLNLAIEPCILIFVTFLSSGELYRPHYVEPLVFCFHVVYKLMQFLFRLRDRYFGSHTVFQIGNKDAVSSTF